MFYTIKYCENVPLEFRQYSEIDLYLLFIRVRLDAVFKLNEPELKGLGSG